MLSNPRVPCRRAKAELEAAEERVVAGAAVQLQLASFHSAASSLVVDIVEELVLG